MSNLSFPQKNDLVVKHKDKKYFGRDSLLFQKHFPYHKLMNDLARANEFTFERLDGQMLYLLLDRVSMDEILNNREEKELVSPPVPSEEEVMNALEEGDNSTEEKDSLIETLEEKAVEMEKEFSIKKKASMKNFRP